MFFLQLCITINNVEHVRKALKPLPDTLQFDRLQSELDKSNVRIQTNLYTMIKESDSNMSKKIKTVVDRVADKVNIYEQIPTSTFIFYNGNHIYTTISTVLHLI